MSTHDHFSACSSQYAAFRPHYPQALYRWLAATAPRCERVWDCGCGSGQASVDLASHFREVIATDLSAEQLAQAVRNDRITYRVAVAEASGLPDAHVDLVTVAQALHWFDLERFYGEARRVLRADGVLAVWCYGVCTISAACGNEHLERFYRHTVGPYWPPERRLVESGYRTIPFPTPELPAPEVAMTLEWSLPELLGYVSSWSATARYIREHSVDPVPALQDAMTGSWGDPQTRHTVHWPLGLRAARFAP